MAIMFTRFILDLLKLIVFLQALRLFTLLVLFELCYEGYQNDYAHEDDKRCGKRMFIMIGLVGR
jgi:hypothetical protein